MTSLYLVALPLIVSFLVTLLLLPFWIRKAKQIGLLWDDMNKDSSERVAGSGGIIVVLGFVIGVFIFIAYNVFYVQDYNTMLVEILALISVALILAGIGFMDDLLGWRKGGLSRRSRLILALIAAIPLVAINAGRSIVSLPLIGSTDLGILYPLLAIPIGIVGATTTFNFLAGFNGLEAGQGIILLTTFAFIAHVTGKTWLGIVALCMVVALVAFLLYNMFPASVFPGDSLTYTVGGLLAIVAILGNFEKIAVFFFIPYILETGLKIRGRLIKESFGRPVGDGMLELRYGKFYSLNHLALFIMKKIGVRSTEKNGVVMIWLFQIVIIAIGFILFKEGIFQ